MRQEIPDINSKLKLDAFHKKVIPDEYKWDKHSPSDYLELKEGKTLEDVLHHPELFKSYPELKGIKVKPVSLFETGTYHGAYFPDTKEIYLDRSSHPEQLRSTLLHEVQHAIQHIEGFVPGTNPTAMRPYVKKALENVGQKDPMEEKNVLNEEDFRKSVLFSKALTEGSSHFYSKVAGEVEARNVQARKDFNEFEREFLSPKHTQDYPYEKQLNPPKE